MLSFTVAVVLARQSLAEASPAEARRLNGEADAEFEASIEFEHNDPDRAATLLRRAGDLYWEAAQEFAENDATRSTRSDLLEKSLSAYRQAQESAPARINIDAPLRILSEYTTSLEETYGENVTSLPQYERALENTQDLRQQSEAFNPPASATSQSDDTITPVETPAEETSKIVTKTEDLRERPRSKPEETSSAAPDETSPAVLARPSARSMKIGLGVSVGLASLAGLASLGTGLSLVSSPFKGSSYLRVKSAFIESGMMLEPGGDLCAPEHQQAVEGIRDACRAYTETRRASVATGIIGGASALSSVVFGALLLRTNKKLAGRRILQSCAIHFSGTRAVLHIGARF